MLDRLFFAVVLVAAAAASVLAFVEPARVAESRAAAVPVVQLQRVVITAPRDDGRALAARDATEPADRTVQ